MCWKCTSESKKDQNYEVYGDTLSKHESHPPFVSIEMEQQMAADKSGQETWLAMDSDSVYHIGAKTIVGTLVLIHCTSQPVKVIRRVFVIFFLCCFISHFYFIHFYFCQENILVILVTHSPLKLLLLLRRKS